MSATLGLNDRDRRTLVRGGSAIVFLFVLARGIPAWRQWDAERSTEAGTAAQHLVEVQGGIESLARLRDSLAVRRARLVALDSVLVIGASPDAVAAGLASLLGDLADDNAVRVSAMQLHSDSIAKAGLARAEVRVTGVTDVEGLAGLLHAIEGAATPLRVRDLSVTQQEPGAPAAKPEALRIDLLVETIGTVREIL